MTISLNSKLSMPSLGNALSRSPGRTRSSAERMWILGGAAATVVVLMFGYLLLIGPQRSETSAVHSQLDQATVQQQQLTDRIAQLESQYKNLGTYKAQLAAAAAALPAGSGVSDLLRSIQSLASETGSSVTNLTVGAPTAVTAAAPAGAAATPTATPTAAATAATAPAAPSGVYSIAITAQVTGSSSALTNFLQKLQEVQPRAVLITQLSESSGAQGATSAGSGQTSLSLSMQTFMTPATAPATAPTAAPTAAS